LANGSFLWSDSTAPTTLPDGAHDEFIVVATNGIGLYTSHDFTAGCTIISGAISCTSDRAQKTDVSAIEARDVLERLVQMPITRWRFLNEPEAVRHMGPMAQDFRASFGLGSDDKMIAQADEGGVALAAIQGLHQLVQEKQATIEAQAREIVELRERMMQVESLRGEVNAMKAALAEVVHAKTTLAQRSPQ